MSTTSRILIAFLLLLAAGLWMLVDALNFRVERQYLEAAEEPMVDTAQIFAALLEQQATDAGALDVAAIRNAFAAAQNREFTARIYNLTKRDITTNLYVTDSRGIVLFDSKGGAAEGLDYSNQRDVWITLHGGYGARSTAENPADPESYIMYVAAPIRHAGAIIGVVSVAKPQRSFAVFRRETQSWVRSLGLAFFFAVAGGAYLVVLLFSRPIRRLTAYTRALADGGRPAAPRLDTPELVALGRAFEEMRDRLEDRKYVERYVQTLTHEMKSPVAAIRGAAELLREPMPEETRERFRANIQAESRRLQNIIDRLLALSAIESRKTLEAPRPVALAELARTVCAQLQPAADARRVRIEVQAESEPEVLGETFLLEIALTNLLQNAIEFAPAESAIEVRVSANDGRAQVTVEDDGPGIPEYALPRVFERFYSLQHPETGRKSSGLGLCFVREAVELHGGVATLANRTDRSGAQAILRLPLAPGGDNRTRLARDRQAGRFSPAAELPG